MDWLLLFEKEKYKITCRYLSESIYCSYIKYISYDQYHKRYFCTQFFGLTWYLRQINHFCSKHFHRPEEF